MAKKDCRIFYTTIFLSYLRFNKTLKTTKSWYASLKALTYSVNSCAASKTPKNAGLHKYSLFSSLPDSLNKRGYCL